MLRIEEHYVQPLLEWEARESDSTTSYTTSYKMPFAWVERAVFLRVPYAEGAYEVSVNGQKAGYAASAHSAVEWDVTPLSKEGNNTLTITLFHRPASRQIEQYAPALVVPRPPVDATIFSQPKVRIRDIVVEADVAHGAGQLTFGAVMATHLLNDKQVRLHYELLAPDSTRLFYGHRDHTLGMRRQDTITFFHRIDAPEIWTPQNPRLYRLVLRLQQGGRYTERITALVGLRGDIPAEEWKLAQFTPSGDLRQDAEAIAALKEQQINTLRLIPHPACEAFYALCDSIGIYIIPQAAIDTRHAGDTRLRDENPTNMPSWRAAYIERVEQMYHGAKRHPSVVGFSLAGPAANGYNLYEAYLRLKALERRRPIVYFDADGEWNSDLITNSQLPITN